MTNIILTLPLKLWNETNKRKNPGRYTSIFFFSFFNHLPRWGLAGEIRSPKIHMLWSIRLPEVIHLHLNVLFERQTKAHNNFLKNLRNMLILVVLRTRMKAVRKIMENRLLHWLIQTIIFCFGKETFKTEKVLS